MAQQQALAHHAAILANPATTWSPTRKGAGVTLSSGNLVATCGLGGTSNGAKVAATYTRDAATANHYFELNPTTIGQYYAIGLIRSDNTPNDSPLGAGSAGEVGYYNNIGYFFYDFSGGGGTGFQASGNPTPGSPVFNAGDVVQCYLTAGTLYFGVVGQGWYDPSTSTYKATPALVVTPFATGITGLWAPGNSNGFGGSTSVGTGRFKASSFTGTMPSGASAWGY